MTKKIVSLCLIMTGLGLSSHGQSDSKKKSIDQIAQELSNPVSLTASLVLQGNYNLWGGSLEGAGDQTSSSLIFLPTLPFKLGKYNLTVRPSFPTAAAPYLDEQGEWELQRGFGDIAVMGIVGRATKTGLLYGIGPTVIAPTASSPRLGKEQWQVGPVVLAGILKKWGVLGVLWQHWWGVGNVPEGQNQVNIGTTQFFYWFSLQKGWQIGGSPIATANYINGVDTDFSIPLNIGLAKTLMVGNTPIKATVQGQYFATRPDQIGPSWGVFFQITPVINVPW
ncbi:hypothetical protein HZ996_06080 [Cryomorphaceae bacterium]|nr:hypothetical protein HZ996_06080 [Cryomorphaceae bacterium]